MQFYIVHFREGNSSLDDCLLFIILNREIIRSKIENINILKKNHKYPLQVLAIYDITILDVR